MKHSYKLLITVVRRGRGDRVVELAKGAGASGSTVLMGRGTSALTGWKMSQNKWLAMLGLTDTEKEIIFTLCSDQELPAVISALHGAPDLCKKVPGVGFVIGVERFFRAGARTAAVNSQNLQKGMEENMDKQACAYTHQLICAIINAGFADDLMLAAREAGATGGTIVKARGTGREEDGSFFGITVMPEKEILMIVAKTEGAPPILKAIRGCPCLQDPGVGIVFCMPAEDFFLLGAHRRDY